MKLILNSLTKAWNSQQVKVPFCLCTVQSRDSVVGIATAYGLDDREVGVRVPVGS
jgi:hypothetical protein